MYLVLPLPYALRSTSTPQGGETRPLFVSFGPRGASGSPRAQRCSSTAVAAAATAASAPAAAAATTTAAAAAETVAATTATRCPRFALDRCRLGRGVPIGRDAGTSAAVGRPTTGCTTTLSAALRREQGLRA